LNEAQTASEIIQFTSDRCTNDQKIVTGRLCVFVAATVCRQQLLLQQTCIHSVQPENSSIYRIFPAISVTLSVF